MALHGFAIGLAVAMAAIALTILTDGAIRPDGAQIGSIVGALVAVMIAGNRRQYFVEALRD